MLRISENQLTFKQVRQELDFKPYFKHIKLDEKTKNMFETILFRKFVI
jgi:hypothetical protein